MKKAILLLSLIVSSLCSLEAQLNVELQAQLSFSQELSDVWGYVDDMGREFALVGLSESVAIVDITTPTTPVLISQIAGPRTIWRDLKTYGNHAFVITDSDGLGLHVFDLSDLPNPLDSLDSYFWQPHFAEFDSTQLRVCHNLYIDENTGIAYLSGCNVNNGGILMVDVTNPDSLEYIGALDARYSHDVYVRNDTVYSSDISDGFLSIMDATNKDSIRLLATQTTPFRFTHNAWLSDNGKVVFTTDERGNAPVAAYDISDLSDIKFLDEFRPAASIGRGLIPHNVHVLNDYLVTSFYKEGIVITDASKPDNLVEVGNYDTYPGDRVSGFDGSWGAYPFLPSGLILASDISNGLFILKPTYTRASYLEGLVTNAETGALLSNVAVTILSDNPNIDFTDGTGVYKTGQVSTGTFSVEFSKNGYQSKVVEVNLETGVVTNMDVALERLPLAVATTMVNCDTLKVKFEPSVTNYRFYSWTFENGIPTSSNAFEPVINYTEAGTYNATLEVKETLTQVADTLSFTVTVVDGAVANFDYTLEGRTIQLTDLSTNADNTSWDLGDGTMLSGTNVSHTYDSTGTYTIGLAANNMACLRGDTIYQEVMITATSLEDLGLLQKFTITPNPYSNETTLDYQLESSGKEIKLSIYNLLGQAVETRILAASDGQITIGEALKSGIYFVQLQMDNQKSRSIKIVKK